ncbi:helix-turn-helix domain-containing protein [Actinoplanes sp. NPDC049118]|uniref:helix-turn-helix domain-containing protein n=1 Tax=Actinoplanes sp. NPDC049118 TaxID=3155769 RepID=UPI0033D79461
MSDAQYFRLSAEAVAPLKHALPTVATQTVEAITQGVPAYAEAFSGPLGPQIEKAVRAALGTFLNLVSRPARAAAGSPLTPALEAAYALGRGEARNGRSLDALLGAYRLGARVAWRELAAISVRGGEDSVTIAHFAELVFAYIDELSAASVAGHADELATSGRARRRHLERLAQVLLAGEPEHVATAATAAAERAEWAPPQTLTAVLVPEPAARAALELLDARTLQAAEGGPEETSVLLVPDAHGVSRTHLMRLLAGRGAIVGPARPWLRVRESLARAVRTARFAPGDGAAAVDTEDHLVALVLGADPQALADLREKALAPLAGERAPTAAKLAETLRGWLLHHGRRDEVAAALFVHPQTVRYRMTRVRELYGDRLRDPQWLLLLTVALA